MERGEEGMSDGGREKDVAGRGKEVKEDREKR